MQCWPFHFGNGLLWETSGIICLCLQDIFAVSRSWTCGNFEPWRQTGQVDFQKKFAGLFVTCVLDCMWLC